MKETGLTHWNSPNAGADNSSGFTGIGAGVRYPISIKSTNHGFGELKTLGFYQVASYNDNGTYPENGMVLASYNNQWSSGYVASGGVVFKIGMSVRFIKDDAIDPGSVTDYDGNEYTTVVIGSQVWTVENFRGTHYNDGTPIVLIQDDDEAWEADTTGAYCVYTDYTTVDAADGYCAYNNDKVSYKEDYGLLYNHLALKSEHGLAYLERDGVQEAGWRVATNADIATLVDAYGGGDNAGVHLKEVGTSLWNPPNTGADNSSGFTGVGNGYRTHEGTFTNIGSVSLIHSDDTYEDEITNGLALFTEQDTAGGWKDAISGANGEKYGCAVRLVRDVTPSSYPQYVYYSDGISIFRKGVRDTSFVIDIALTELGFDGDENTDWQNVDITTI